MESDSESYGSDFELDPADKDLSWDDPISPEEEARLKLIKTQDRPKWIPFHISLAASIRARKPDVKAQTGEDREGNGFYVNMPHPTHHVILTAGHNLVGVKNEDLKIYPAPKNAIPGTARFYVSAVYKEKPIGKEATAEQEENDFGVILVERDPKHPYLGFGFALKLGHDALIKDQFEIVGYKEADDNNDGGDDDENQSPNQNQKEKPKWDTFTSNGKCIACLPNQVEYELETEQGSSGSPVIMPHKDRDTAVAIHNYGPLNGRKSRGTRINEKVLDEIYTWLKIGYYGRALQASISNTSLLHERLYLVFTPDSERAMVRLGYDKEMVTKFDVLPAYAPPSNYGFPNDFRYVFRLKPQTGGLPEKCWVLWNAGKQTISLTSTLKDLCFASLLEDKVRKLGEPEKKGEEKAYYVHLEMKNDHGESTELKELRMRAADLTESDLVLDSLETSEVFFERHKRGKFLFGKIPCMPEVLSKPAAEREKFDFNLFRFYSG